MRSTRLVSRYGIGAQAVDREKRVIRGFAVATMGPAQGHGEVLDQETLQQIVALGNANGPIRCRMDHPADDGVANDLEKLLGHATAFRLDGDVVRADLQLLSPAAAPLSDRFLSLAAEAPDLFGASMVFAAAKGKGPKPQPVRLKTLFAVDFVDIPAANPFGLFSAGDEDTTVKSTKAYCKDGKFFCKFGEEEFELEGYAPPPPPKKDDEPPGDGKFSAAKVAEEREAAKKEEREYAKAFRTALGTAGISGKDAEEFETKFYGRPIEDVKFLASHAIGARAKPVGEGAEGKDGKGSAGDGKETPEEKEAKAIEADATQHFAATRQVRISFGVRTEDKDSDEYKAGLKRYVARCRQWAEDAKPEAQRRLAATLSSRE